MKIGNDYPVYSGQNYESRPSSARENAPASPKQELPGNDVFPKEKGSGNYRIRRGNVELTLHTAMPKQSTEKASEPNSFRNSLWKDFWNGLGEEAGGESKSLFSVLKEKVWSPLYGIFLRMGETLKGFFSKDTSAGLSARFKSELSAALKKIGKGNLHGLTDGQTLTGGSFANTGSQQSQEKNPEQTQEQEPVTYVRSSHITDSYTKDGSYCTIGDLNYHKSAYYTSEQKRNRGEKSTGEKVQESNNT